MTQYQDTRPEEAPFDEPVEEPPENPIPYSDPYPAETPGRPADPSPSISPPEFRGVAEPEKRPSATDRFPSRVRGAPCAYFDPAEFRS